MKRRGLKPEFYGTGLGFSAKPFGLLLRKVSSNSFNYRTFVVTGALAHVIFLFEMEHRRLHLQAHENKKRTYAHPPRSTPRPGSTISCSQCCPTTCKRDVQGVRGSLRCVTSMQEGNKVIVHTAAHRSRAGCSETVSSCPMHGLLKNVRKRVQHFERSSSSRPFPLEDATDGCRR